MRRRRLSHGGFLNRLKRESQDGHRREIFPLLPTHQPADRCILFTFEDDTERDLQSYLSRLTLFLAPESKKFFILVDNQPWLIAQDTRPTHLWQLMVTKSRMSPFANTRARKEKKDTEKKLDSVFNLKPCSIKLKYFNRWFSLVDAALCQKKAMLPVKKLKYSVLLNKELHHTLYGFIVFEVAWDRVRGINYLNELQTDTSMALEAKMMKRWEFDSTEQASRFISSWFSGTYYDGILLQGYLDNLSNKGDVFYDALADASHIKSSGDEEEVSEDGDAFCGDHGFYDGSSNAFHDSGTEDASYYTPPPPSGPYKRRKIMKLRSDTEDEKIPEGAFGEIVTSPRVSVSSSSSESTDSDSARIVFEATGYKDVLILFRFDDHDLPFKLKDIIMSDLRLLTLLEYGLPSWVIFLQSYPVFCQIYRPWMCPLARVLYVLMSIITVLIGFYDLYKNVPLLKATASRLFGPFFDWIETWEMISRIKYLGTMLFLHNFEKSVKWVLMITRSTRSLLLVITRPIADPVLELVEFILPFWNICIETIDRLCSVTWILLGSSCSLVIDILQIIIWPFLLVFKTVWSIATSVIYPILWVLWEILVAPVRFVLATASFIMMLFVNVSYFIKESWSFLSIMFQFTSASEATKGAYEVSMWRSLWNDLFSQIFRAVRSILYGFVAFFSTCNRHRLSIYNHLQEFILHISHPRRGSCHSDYSHHLREHRAQTHYEASRSPKLKNPSLSQEKLHARRSRKID